MVRGVHRDAKIDREEGRGEFCAKLLLRVQFLVLPFPDKLAIHAAFMSRPVAKFMQRRRIVFVDVLICLFRQEVNDVSFRRVAGCIGITRDVVEDLRAACCADRLADLALFLVRIALRLRLPLLERMIVVDRLAVFVQEAAAVLVELVLASDAVRSMEDGDLLLRPILIFRRQEIAVPVPVHLPMRENSVAVGAFLHAVLPFEFGRVLLPCRLHQLDLLLMDLVLLSEHGHSEEARIVALLLGHDHREEHLVETCIGSVRLAVDGHSYELCADLAIPSFLPRNPASFQKLDDLLRRFHIDVAFWVLHSAFLPFIGSVFHLHEVFFRLYFLDVF